MKAWIASIACAALLLSLFAQQAGAAPKDLSRDEAVEVSEQQNADSSAEGESSYNLGIKYQTGTGGVGKDLAVAAGWFRRSAEHGYARAQYALGAALDNGDGVKKNYGEALKWYSAAAAQGSAKAKAGLGLLYDKGRGVKRDYAEAAKWYREAAEQGIASAQYGLGMLYKDGHGVARDYAEAYFWLALAARSVDKAMDARDETGRKLDPKTLKAARGRATDWKPLVAPEIAQ